MGKRHRKQGDTSPSRKLSAARNEKHERVVSWDMASARDVTAAMTFIRSPNGAQVVVMHPRELAARIAAGAVWEPIEEED